MIKTDDLTIGQVKELVGMLSGAREDVTKQTDFEVGKKYFIRTVTHHYIGKCVEVLGRCVVMSACVWVADDGRFSEAMKGNWDSNSEHEIYPPSTKVQIFYGGILDAPEWDHPIPVSTK